MTVGLRKEAVTLSEEHQEVDSCRTEAAAHSFLSLCLPSPQAARCSVFLVLLASMWLLDPLSAGSPHTGEQRP